MGQLLLYPSSYRWDLISSKETVYWVVPAMLLVYLMLLEIIEKILLDCDTMILFYYFTIYTAILFILILILSLYYPNNLGIWMLSDLSKLNNNVIGQLTPRLEKLMKKTVSVF